MPKFKVIKQNECSVCKGAGKFTHPDGDIERCTLCGSVGYWESEVGFEEVADDLGYVLAQPAQPVGEAAGDAVKAIEVMRAATRFVNMTNEDISATAFVAIAEQLALLNMHAAELADSISYYVANKV